MAKTDAPTVPELRAWAARLGATNARLGATLESLKKHPTKEQKAEVAAVLAQIEAEQKPEHLDIKFSITKGTMEPLELEVGPPTPFPKFPIRIDPPTFAYGTETIVNIEEAPAGKDPLILTREVSKDESGKRIVTYKPITHIMPPKQQLGQ